MDAKTLQLNAISYSLESTYCATSRRRVSRYDGRAIDYTTYEEYIANVLREELMGIPRLKAVFLDTKSSGSSWTLIVIASFNRTRGQLFREISKRMRIIEARALGQSFRYLVYSPEEAMWPSNSKGLSKIYRAII